MEVIGNKLLLKYLVKDLVRLGFNSGDPSPNRILEVMDKSIYNLVWVDESDKVFNVYSYGETNKRYLEQRFKNAQRNYYRVSYPEDLDQVIKELNKRLKIDS